eukprot:TRINITY_DN8781_c0_g4_i1.p1 TRINITY_DN8781_c0_g4~~TRINITY_DN8781_c0_g4_i1.p1  ORF type:complete len:221 (+),score=30.22 TRINITY_DN8781_c0_g4_i1:114-776(+)
MPPPKEPWTATFGPKLMSNSGNLNFNALIERERAARLHMKKAARPVPPVYQHLPEFPALSPPTRSVSSSVGLSPKFGGSQSTGSLPTAVQLDKAVEAGAITPTMWAGLPLETNPKYMACITSAAVGQPPGGDRRPRSVQALLPNLRRGKGASEELAADGELMLTSHTPHVKTGVPADVTVSLARTLGSWRPASTASSHVPTVVNLPGHMLSYPATGQWLL